MNATPPLISRLVGHLGPKSVFVVVLLILLALLSGIFLGRYIAYRDMNGVSPTERSARLALSALRKELNVVRGDIQMQRTRHDVDKQALELVRSEMVAQKERIAELEESLGFYRSLVAPDEGGAGGLSLREPELVAGDTSGSFQYRIFVQHQSRERKVVDGTLSVEVFGSDGEKEVHYPLSKLSETFDDEAMTLHFRYFQAIEGELVFPEGFEPKGLRVIARASKPRKMKVRKEFPWVVQERFVNVGN
jgi:hypothetical protein